MKKNILIYFIIYSTFYIAQCFGQSITWQRTYDSPIHGQDIGYDICKANGDNYYIVGYSQYPPYGQDSLFVLKVNEFGDTLWCRFINGGVAFAAVSSGDGGCVLTGANGVAFTVKLDSLGNTVWNRTYGGSDIFCYDIVRSTDGSYLACGYRISLGYDGYILKIDSIGNLLWQLIIPSSGSKRLYTIIEAIDGGYLLGGAYQQTLNDLNKGLLIKLDTNGNAQWEKTFQILGKSTGIHKLIKTDNYYLASGDFAFSQFLNVFFGRISIYGDTTFVKSFSTVYQEYRGLIEIINPNKYIFSSFKDTIATSLSFSLIRIIDSVGNVIKQKKFYYGIDRHDGIEIFSIQKNNENDFLFSGSGNLNFLSDTYAMRTDTFFNAPPIGISNSEINEPYDPYLFTCYPNPFNSMIIIKYHIPNRSQITLKIFDITGKEVDVLINNDEFEKGFYEINWNAENLASGLFFCILYINNKSTIINKMIHLK
jgi:hypothetical protein